MCRLLSVLQMTDPRTPSHDCFTPTLDENEADSDEVMSVDLAGSDLEDTDEHHHCTLSSKNDRSKRKISELVASRKEMKVIPSRNLSDSLAENSSHLEKIDRNTNRGEVAHHKITVFVFMSCSHNS